MEYIRVTKDNLEKEHICCAISNNNDVQVASKKAWLSDCFDDGLVFLKKVNGEFEQFAKDWGCTSPLDDKPYARFVIPSWVVGQIAK